MAQYENSNISKAEFKKTRAGDAVKRQKRKVIFWIILVGVCAVGVIWGLIALSRSRNTDLPGTLFSDQGQQHVGLGHAHTYNSNPPTSGPHFAKPADWGVYQEELPDEELVHNLEHGGVWVSYKPGIPEDIKKKLEGFYKKYGTKVIVTPRAKNDADIALAVWTRLDKFSVSDFSEERVDSFIKKLRNRTAPEPLAM